MVFSKLLTAGSHCPLSAAGVRALMASSIHNEWRAALGQTQPHWYCIDQAKDRDYSGQTAAQSRTAMKDGNSEPHALTVGFCFV